MAFAPNAFSGSDGSVYSEWEVHKLSSAAVRRFALASLSSVVVLLLLDVLVFRDGRPDALLPGWAGKIALGLAGAIAGALFTFAQLKRNELSKPEGYGVTLALLLAGAGALSTVSGGGLSGPLAFGLVPVLWLYALLFPRGLKASVLPVFGGLLLHLGAVLALTGAVLPAEARAVAVSLVLGTAVALAASQVIEHWRVKAAELSQADWLTSALARPWLEERLKTLCLQRSRSLSPVTLVMFDVDRFKVINDTFGRAAGDEVLEMLVSGIKSEIRGGDFIGRLGGDEFLLVLDECEGPAALSLLDRLRTRFASKPMMVGDDQVKVSFAAGVVSVPAGEPLAVKELLKKAERALSDSKDQGRNRTAVANPPAGDASRTQVLVEVSGEPVTDSAAPVLRVVG